MSVSVSCTALFYTLSMEISRVFSTILGNLERKTQQTSCQPNNSLSCQLNIHSEENSITSISDLVASDETDEDNNEHSQESSRIRETKSKTKVITCIGTFYTTIQRRNYVQHMSKFMESNIYFSFMRS